MSDILAQNERLAECIAETFDRLAERVDEDPGQKDDMTSVLNAYVRGCEVINDHIDLPPRQKEALMIAAILTMSYSPLEEEEIAAKYGDPVLSYMEEKPQNGTMYGPYMSSAIAAIHIASFAEIESRMEKGKMGENQLDALISCPPQLDAAMVGQIISPGIRSRYEYAERSLLSRLQAASGAVNDKASVPRAAF